MTNPLSLKEGALCFQGNIVSCCKLRLKTAYGYSWRYLDITL